MAKRGRQKYFNKCMEFLRSAAQSRNIEYIVSQDNGKGPFHKSKLLNDGLRVMRSDFDFVSIVDIDVIYRPHFFNIIEKTDDRTFFVAKGNNLDEYTTNMVLEGLVDTTNLTTLPGAVNVGRSQVTMSKRVYEILLNTLGREALYEEGFVGWGGEDSALSCLRTHLVNVGKINSVEQTHMWYHLFHEPQPDKALYREANNGVLTEINDKYKKLVYKEEEKPIVMPSLRH